MLFNSYVFIFGFLPIVLIGHQIAAHFHRRAVIVWLALTSLAFYGYWRPAYLVLLCSSVLFNYFAGALISGRIRIHLQPRTILIMAVTVNLVTLCYYKYLFPFLDFVGRAAHQPHHWTNVVLPLGISFFTFTQIAYLVDLEQGSAVQQDLGSYTLFATFFPHLIAGPILHHAEMMPQFTAERDYRLRIEDLTVGFSWFVMGLCKKVLLADRFALTADPAFAATTGISTFAAWIGTLSYALQLYFDFSGYSDMALGLARMFSIDFPLNFNSPYKADSIIDFWQRWHMTLTRYINVYLYNPISMWVSRRRAALGKKISRKAMATPLGFTSMVAMPTMTALFLAGIWHGAGLQFLAFGLLHGFYLTINHAWRVFRGGRDVEFFSRSAVVKACSHASRVLLTFGAVIVAQVFFRATGVQSAVAMLAGVSGLHRHATAPVGSYQPAHTALIPIAAGLAIVWLLPNTQQILIRFKPALNYMQERQPVFRGLQWKPNLAWSLTLGLAFFFALIKLENPSTFLYFQF